MEQKSLWGYFASCFTESYCRFSGRARRREYWGFVLFNVLVSWGIMLVGMALGWHNEFVYPLNVLYGLIAFLPALGAIVRRLHDTGRSGWWFLISLIPIAGVILLLIWFCTEGERGDNKYGSDPKAEL